MKSDKSPDLRISSLQSASLPSAYSGRKKSLKAELEGFIYALPDNKSLFDAIPLDACRFLVFKDSKGKAQVHNMGCPHRTLHRTLLIGNPSSDLLVKQYLKEFTAEQLRASIAPKQAVPPFAGKLLLLSLQIEKTSSPLVPLAN